MKTNPSQPNLLNLEIRDLSQEGSGIGHDGSRVAFVTGALPGELVEARLTGASRGMVRGEIRKLLRQSPDRRLPACILAGECGGCSLQHWNDAAQAEWKQNNLQQALQRIGGLSIQVEPIIAATAVMGYRNRAIIPIQPSSSGIKAGFYRRQSHDVVNMNHCPVLDPRLDELIGPIKQDLVECGWPAYCEASHSGELRHLVLRIGVNSGEILLGLVTKSPQLDGFDILAEEWLERWPAVVGVVHNCQPKPTNTLLGEQQQLIAGRPWLLERFANCSFAIGLDTFFQVHTAQAERLVPLLKDGLGLGVGEVLVDAFCGVGTLGLPLVGPEAKLIGIEQHQASIERAQDNARLNNIDNAEFLVGSVEQKLAEVLPVTDALLLDPPRKGLSDPLINIIQSCPPDRIAYVSCNPSTLARDLSRLCADGMLELLSVQPLDFFPQTTHCEALALLKRVAVR